MNVSFFLFFLGVINMSILSHASHLNIKHYLTSKNTDHRLSLQTSSIFEDKSEQVDVVINPNKKYQTLIGFGAAFTESSAMNFHKLSKLKQDEFISNMFNPSTGHGYVICRTHINSCDFSLNNYAYTEVPGDSKLEHFSIDREKKILIPLIKRALKEAKHPIKIFASPWSPPAWMKTNGEMNNGGKLKPEYRESWALYYARYIQAFEKEGIPIWGLTVQNEPEAVQVWDSCIYTAEEERDFVRDYLGPTLHKEGLSDKKLIIWDHNRDEMFRRASVVLNDPDAAKYVWGTGFHWYGEDCFENVQRVHDAFPDKHLIFTEGCQEGGPHIGSWKTGERYARSIINDLNRWTVAWVDWNILLDTTGGFNHVGNLCSAPVLADHENDELLYQSSYYYIGHFSRFIKSGAQRIHFEANDPLLEMTVFENPDGQIVIVCMNRNEEEKTINIKCKKNKFSSILDSRSISTFVLN